MGTMQVILYENIAKLGKLGSIVSVKTGYARNFLLPFGKAIRNTKDNRAFFEEQKETIIAKNLEKKQDAQSIFDFINGQNYVMIVQTSETGQLYGSVNARDISQEIKSKGANVEAQKINIVKPFKSIGIYTIDIVLHADVIAQVKINIARSHQEAEIQKEAGMEGPAALFYQMKQDEEDRNKHMTQAEKAERKFNQVTDVSQTEEEVQDAEEAHEEPAPQDVESAAIAEDENNTQ